MALREFVADICRAHILPMLERRLLTLNHAVTSARKGVRNALKSWWRKPREETGTPTAGLAAQRWDPDQLFHGTG